MTLHSIFSRLALRTAHGGEAVPGAAPPVELPVGVSAFPAGHTDPDFSHEQLHSASRLLDGVEEAWSWLVVASGGDRRAATDVLRHVERLRRAEGVITRAFGRAG